MVRTERNSGVRRAILAVCAAATLVAGSALPATASGSVNVERPFEGSIITSATAVVVAVQEDGCGGALEDPATASVDARLATHDGQPFPGSHEAALQRNGDCADTTRWGGVSVDPAAPMAFFGSGAAPMCNGRWRLQARADGGSWGTGASFQVRRPPAAPADVAAQASGDLVKVTWTKNREPDLAGYRVERRYDGGTWLAAGSVAPSTTSLSDDDVSAGTWEYRVVALRPDGDGQQACQDTEPDLETASASRQVTVAEQPAPGASPSPSPSPRTGGGSTDGSSSDGSEDSGGTTGDDTSSDGSSEPGTTDGGDWTTGGSDTTSSGSTDGSSSGRRIAAPPAATRTGPDTSAPVLPEVAGPGQPRERYYGEDEEYDPALDFGGAEPVEGSETRSRTRTTVAERMVPQAVQDLVARYVDPHRVLKPIAAGLVLVAVAMHLRRWSREQHV